MSEEVLTVYKGHTLLYSEYEALVNLEAFISKINATYKITVEACLITELKINHSGLKSIPKELIMLKNLKKLDLRGNKINDLTGLEKLMNLEVLYIRNNKIKNNADDNVKIIRSINSLKELEIDGKGLTEDQLDKLYY